MKKHISLIITILLTTIILSACNGYEADITGTWITKGSNIGLNDEVQEYDILLTFKDNNTASLVYQYADGKSDETTFKYSTENEYLIIDSYGKAELNPNENKYIYSIENETLTIEVKNQNVKFELVK